MPAEWEPHAATWLAWPKNPETWPGPVLKEVESIYLRMISELLAGERVNLVVPNAGTQKKVLGLLPRKTKTQNLLFHKADYVDSWIRDWGPIFIRHSEPRRGEESHNGKMRSFALLRSAQDDVRSIAFTKWRFNAWGGKYADIAKDNGVVNRIAALKKYKRFDTGIVLEGGSIDLNGRGACLTTEQCLLNPNRNPRLSKKEIEGYLKKYLGVEKVIWLKEGIEGDDTDGHVDDIARFVGPKRALCLGEVRNVLKQATDQDGRSLEVWELPGCDPLPSSYANFYIGNRVVLVPTYTHANDSAALKIIQKAFPKRKVVGIECSALVRGLGSIHCVTQQEPR